jgi:hypothetical protein
MWLEVFRTFPSQDYERTIGTGLALRDRRGVDLWPHVYKTQLFPVILSLSLQLISLFYYVILSLSLSLCECREDGIFTPHCLYVSYPWNNPVLERAEKYTRN